MNPYDSMKRSYSKMWCNGFCRTCGTSCADHSEDAFELRAERDRYKALADSRPTRERYNQLIKAKRRMYEAKQKLEIENEKLVGLLKELGNPLTEE